MTNEEIIIELRNEDMFAVQLFIYLLLEDESLPAFRERLVAMVKNRDGGDNTVRGLPCRLVFDRERDELPG